MSDASLPARIGRYEIIRLIGEGGMGRVFLAHDPVLARDVAIKVLRDDLSLPGDVKTRLLARMQNEARAAATIRHPNLVTLHDMGDDAGVGVFLVFEYVEGPTLRERIASSGALPPLEVARIAMELGAALTAAHDAGTVHRDVKPENIICSATGATLMDFGMARSPDSNASDASAIGSVAYAAPETLVGAKPVPTSAASPASDQFSLASTLYEALSGRRPFTGDDVAAVAAAITNDAPLPLATSDTDYREKLMLTRADGVLRRALQKDPAHRYPTSRAFGDALGAAIDVRVSSGFPTISMHSASIVPKATRRWQNIVVGVAVAVIFALILIGRKQHPNATTPTPTPSPSPAPSRTPSPPPT